jgi:pimeloyl-ACP methyl ester carboxylesterase
MPLLATDSGAIFYAQRGRAGPALICLHGAGGSHSHWGYQLRDLSDIARVYALDLPGHGRSSAPASTAPASVASYSAALLDFMDACGLDQAVLAGHSMGGAIALWAALDAPERVLGLGLVGTGARLRVAPAILDGFDSDLAATIRLIVDYAYAPAAPDVLLRQAEADYAHANPATFRADFSACDSFDIRARLAEIRCPAAIICGSADRMTPPKYSETLRDGIPGATLTLVPNAGHMATIEQPDAVNQALRELLRSV